MLTLISFGLIFHTELGNHNDYVIHVNYVYKIQSNIFLPPQKTSFCIAKATTLNRPDI